MATTNTISMAGALPPLNLEQVRQKLVALLSCASDLSAYIEEVKEGKIVVKNFGLPNQPGCSTLPVSTLIGQSVPDQRLERVRDAIALVNLAFQGDGSLPLFLSKTQPACIDANGLEIAAQD